jgi:hypothetical protein
VPRALDLRGLREDAIDQRGYQERHEEYDKERIEIPTSLDFHSAKSR